MKKILILLMITVFISCVDNDACKFGTGEVPDNNIEDMDYSMISKNPLGGDPRGTYFANDPLLIFISLDTVKTITDSIVTSKGSLMYEFTGKSALEGKYVLIEESFDIEAYLIWKNPYGQSDVSFLQKLNNDPAKKIDGTWKVEENLLILKSCNQERAVQFTSNSNGLFFISNYVSPIVGNYNTVMSYKRQPE